MKKKLAIRILEIKPILISLCIATIFVDSVSAQQYKIAENGDTLNKTNANGKRVGKWVIEMPELRGEPGYTEEGAYDSIGEKDGYWRKYGSQGDLIALESYIHGGKAGNQKYYTYLGVLEREENWRPYNPDAPYDTIPIYGEGNGEILNYKIVKSQPYSIKDGVWKYYDAETGRLLRTENWDRNVLIEPEEKRNEGNPNPTRKIDKNPEMLKGETKPKGKKKY